MESALDWLRNNEAAARDLDDLSDLASFKSLGLAKDRQATSEEKRVSEMASALDWLRSNDAAGTGSLDDMSLAPIRSMGGTGIGGNSKMAAALDWLRQNDGDLGGFDDPSVGSRSARSGGTLATRGPITDEEKRARDMAAALDWMRGAGGLGGADDPSVASKLSHGPQSIFDPTAQSMNDALAWLRKNDVGMGGLDDPSVASIKTSKSLGSRGPLTDEERRARDMAGALDWLKGNDATSLTGVDDPSVASMGHLGPGGLNLDPTKIEMYRKRAGLDDSSLASKKGPLLPEQQKASQMESALDWLRTNSLDVSDIDLDTLSAFRNLAGMSSIRDGIAIADKPKALNEAMDWVRRGSLNPDEVDDAAVETFANLAGLSLPKVELTHEEKDQAAREALEWLRDNNMDLKGVDDMSLPNLANLTGVKMPHRKLSKEEKKNAMELAPKRKTRNPAR